MYIYIYIHNIHIYYTPSSRSTLGACSSFPCTSICPPVILPGKFWCSFWKPGFPIAMCVLWAGCKSLALHRRLKKWPFCWRAATCCYLGSGDSCVWFGDLKLEFPDWQKTQGTEQIKLVIYQYLPYFRHMILMFKCLGCPNEQCLTPSLVFTYW